MQYHRIYARIDIDAILHNLGECKRRIPEGTKVLAVIKADGYGHGAVELAHQLESEVDYFGVAVIEEAVEKADPHSRLYFALAGRFADKL